MFEPHGFCCSPPTAVIICCDAASPPPELDVPTAGPLLVPAQCANACWVTKNSDAMLLPHGFCCSPPTAVIICCDAASPPPLEAFDTAGARCGLAARVEP